MRNPKRLGRRQQGLSAVGWLLIVAIFGLLIVSFFKVFPMYYGNFKLKNALQSVAQDSEIDPKSKRAIWEGLSKRLFVDEVRGITREQVKMQRKDGRTTITVDYETRDSWVGNLYIVAKFSESIVIER